MVGRSVGVRIIDYFPQFVLTAQHFVESHYLLILFAAGWLMLMRMLGSTYKYVPAILVGLIGAFWLSYSDSILEWASHLGTDSFSEARNFDPREAWFLVVSLKYIFHFTGLRTILPVLAWALILIGAVRAVLALAAFKNASLRAKPLISLAFGMVAVAFVALPLYVQASKSLVGLELDSADLETIRQNFHGHPVPLANTRTGQGAGPNNIDVLVYIGESTTVMDMGIYGYPRPTTPLLEKFRAQNDGLLVFHNVFSTHTHTSPSLLEALSVAVAPGENYLPIRQRKRSSIVDLLNRLSIPSLLLSNQGNSGTWSQASSVVFHGAAIERFSRNSALLGNAEYRLERPWDHVYFADAVTQMGALKARPPRVAFLHSYAGHGDYLDNIGPNSRTKVDGFLDAVQPAAVAGNAFAKPDHIRSIEDYDSAMRYVDFSVHSVLEHVKNAAAPTVLIYFSDHGDSAYTGREHDSSRLVHEMLRVPFLVYFNDAAQQAYSTVFHEFSAAALDRRVSTLAQFPATLLRILGYESPDGHQGVGFDPQSSLTPIMVRRTAAGYSQITISGDTPPTKPPIATIEAPDATTAMFAAAQSLRRSATQVCQHRSNTLATALRGALATGCLEFDLTVQDDGTLAVYHPPATDVGLTMGMVADIAQRRDRALWVDGKNLDQPKNCRALAAFFDDHPYWHHKNVLVEFPSSTPLDNRELQACARGLVNNGFRTSFYLPDDIARACSAALKTDGDGAASCKGLAKILKDVQRSKAFTDISFDYGGVGAVEKLAQGLGLNWNTWGVAARAIAHMDPTRFRMIIAESEDPNFR